MNNFSQFIRHIWLINTCIVVYTCKKLICMAKGEKLKPSFNMKMVYEYMEDIKDGKRLKPMPMGAYEYSCCVKYLKKIKSILKSSREDFHSLVLEFGEKDKSSENFSREDVDIMSEIIVNRIKRCIVKEKAV